MLFKKQIRLVLLLPIIFTCVIIMLISFIPWYQKAYKWINIVGDFLANQKEAAFETYSYGKEQIYITKIKATSYSIQIEFQSMAIKQLAVTSLFYQIMLGNIPYNPDYNQLLFNQIDETALDEFDEMQAITPNLSEYSSSWYNPNETQLTLNDSLNATYNFGYVSFLPRAIMKTTYTNLKKQNLVNTLENDGTTFFYPSVFVNATPTNATAEYFNESYVNCSYNETERNYFYEYRCQYWYQNTKNTNNTVKNNINKICQNLVFNRPFLFTEFSNGSKQVSNILCSRITNPYNNDTSTNFYSSICSKYDTSSLLKAIGAEDQITFSTIQMKTYVIYTGSRLPLLYPEELTELSNIEDLIYADALPKEKQNFIQQTAFFQTVYNTTQQDCVGFSGLQSNKTVRAQRDQQDYLYVARNLSVCIVDDLLTNQTLQSGQPVSFTNRRRLQQSSTQFSEQIIGTIVTELSFLDEQLKAYEIVSKNTRIIQITITLSTLTMLIIGALLGWYSRVLAQQISDPIDEIIDSLRNINEENIDKQFIDILDGDQKNQTSDEMTLLVRSVYDFVGIVKIANQALQQGNVSQAIIEYAVAEQFYKKNGNNLGAGVIQNNMGVIHLTNRRYQECIISFRDSIMQIEREWDIYKNKYLQCGVTEAELQIDNEFQKFTNIVLNRCFNIAECLTQYLSLETHELESFLSTFEKKDNNQFEEMKSLKRRDNLHDQNLFSYGRLIQQHSIQYSQSLGVRNQNLRKRQTTNRNKRLSGRYSISQIKNIFFKSTTQVEDRINSNSISKSQVKGTVIIEQKLTSSLQHVLNDIHAISESLSKFRMRFADKGFYTSIVSANSFQFQKKQVKDKTVEQTQTMIQQLWKDSTETYIYCIHIIENHLVMIPQRRKKLYIFLKIIFGLIKQGQLHEAENVIEQSEEILNELIFGENQVELDKEVFQFPISVLKQKLHLYKAIYYIKTGQNRQAVQQLNESIKTQGQYSPRDRIEALTLLRQIFNEQNISQHIFNYNFTDSDPISQQLAIYQPVVKDVVILLDIGKFMSVGRNMIRAVNFYKKIIPHLTGNNDRVGYYLFDQTVSEVFPPMALLENQVYIEKIFSFVPQPRLYSSNVFNAMRQGIQKIVENEHSNTYKYDGKIYLKEQGQVQKQYKRCINFDQNVLDSNDFKVSNNILHFTEEFYSIVKTLQNELVNLIIVNFNNEIVDDRIDNLPKFVHVLFENQSEIKNGTKEIIGQYFQSLEQSIEQPGSTFYLEQTI